jgi:DNA-binding MarR family transcriptional regulator
VEPGAHRELKLLEAIAENDSLTQRRLASRLGIAVGLANLYLRRLARKGYIKCINVRPNRVRYLLTPKGIAEKSRLTYEFMAYSVQVFREGRRHLKSRLEQYAAADPSARISIYGTGDAAELAYFCLKELGLEPAVVFDGHHDGTFFGKHVVDVRDHRSIDYDIMILAVMDHTSELVTSLAAQGVPRSKMLTLRPADADEAPPTGDK